MTALTTTIKNTVKNILLLFIAAKINTQKENIKKGYYENNFFEGDEKINYTEQEIENIKFDISCMEEKIKDAWIV